MNEQLTMKEIMLAVGKHFPKVTKLFRNNTGQAWVGKARSLKDKVIIENARVLHAGLCEGSSDLIGWTEFRITANMVGQKVAIFTAVEVKAPKGKASEKQINFLGAVAQAGGIAGIARNEQEFVNIINGRIAANEQQN